jgi:hypothetical protein
MKGSSRRTPASRPSASPASARKSPRGSPGANLHRRAASSEGGAVFLSAVRELIPELVKARHALDALWAAGLLAPSEYQQRLRSMRRARRDFDRFAESALQRGRRRLSAVGRTPSPEGEGVRWIARARRAKGNAQVHRRLTRPEDWASAIRGLLSRAAAVRAPSLAPARRMNSQEQRQLARYCGVTRDCALPCAKLGKKPCHVVRGAAARNPQALHQGSVLRKQRADRQKVQQQEEAAAKKKNNPGLAARLAKKRQPKSHRGTPIYSAIRASSTAPRKSQ